MACAILRAALDGFDDLVGEALVNVGSFVLVFHLVSLVDGVVYKKTTPEPLGGESGEARSRPEQPEGNRPSLERSGKDEAQRRAAQAKRGSLGRPAAQPRIAGVSLDRARGEAP